MEKAVQVVLAELMVGQVSSIAVRINAVKKILNISIIPAAWGVAVDLDALEISHPQEEMVGQLLLGEVLKII